MPLILFTVIGFALTIAGWALGMPYLFAFGIAMCIWDCLSDLVMQAKAQTAIQKAQLEVLQAASRRASNR